ncbi:TonB-dependent siderophore receptor [Bordetella trematum]|uniref:TonB-dependent alcaligin siderophore receptor FauA n=1 Tax=Bordetella trematum TaxID=123899 RepID=UPI003AF386DE
MSPAVPVHGAPRLWLATLPAALIAAWSGHAMAQAADAAVAELPAVSVTATAQDGITEGTQRYTTPVMNTATGLTLSPQETPQTVSVVTRQQIEDEGLLDTAAILANAPGISVTRSDSNRYAFSSRGFAIDSFQFDGLVSPILSQWNYGATDMDSAIFDRVEIVRGATGLMTGSGNPSAAVNFVRKRPLRDFSARATLNAGSWNHVRSEADISAPLTEDGRIRSRVVAAYSQADSYVTDLDSRKRTLYAVLSADLTPSTELTASVEYQRNQSHGFGSGFPLFYSDGSRTDFNRSASNNTPWARLDTESVTYFMDLTHRLDNDWRLRAAYSHNDGKYRMRQLYRGGYPDRNTGLGMSSSFSNYDGRRDRDDFHLSVSGPFELFGRRHEIAAGWMSIRDHNDIRQFAMIGPPPAVGSYFNWGSNRIAEPQWAEHTSPADNQRTKQTGKYVVGRFSLADPLHLILGGRWSDWETQQTYFGSRRAYKVDNQFTPYAGVVLDINDTYAAYASYTDIFQPQNARSPDGSILDPIEGKSYELGLKGSYLEGRLNAALALFETRQDNLAQAIPGETVAGFPNQQAYRAAKGAKVRGFDLQAAGEIARGWNISASYTHFTAGDAQGQAINTSQPRSLLKLYTTYQLPGDLHQLTVGGGLTWQSRMYQYAASPTGKQRVEQGSYALVDLMARYDINRHLSATLNVNNLLDRKYYDQIGFFSQGWWGAPRNVMLSLRAQY